MQPTAFASLPIIDIEPLIAGGARAAPTTVDLLGRAAREVGFFYVTGHGCPAPLIQRLVERAEEFFAQPIERKMDVYIGKSRNHRGFVPVGEEVFASGTIDKKEAFDLSIDLAPDDPEVALAPHLHGPNQWPDLTGFASDITAYYQTVFGIGRTLIQAFAVSLGREPGFFDPFLLKPPSQLRLIHYPFNPEARDETGIGAHTDYECFTILHATSPGLEVMNGQGRWVDAPPVPRAFVINIGDLLEFWSDGRFAATTHRVRKTSSERYSFPLFFNVDYATRVTPMGAAGDAGLVAGDHLYAQTVQTFRYLQQRLVRGEIALPPDARPAGSFGHGARLQER